MRKIFTIFLLFFTAISSFAQQGPAAGSIPSGTIKNTDDFNLVADTPSRLKLFNKVVDPREKSFLDGTEEFSFVEDAAFTNSRANGRDSVILYENFYGIPQTNSIPPDPYIAVGPDHIVETVNTSWRITDKQGNVIKTIDAGSWFSYPGKSFDPFDPKVIYDHFSNRWVQVWLHANDNDQESYFLFSVSDDADPTGVWYNWALPSDENGNTFAGNWADYQGVGFDDKAIYLTSNQFTFAIGGSGNTYDYSKLRIVKKEDLYQNAAGEVNWFDFWQMNDFGIRPVRSMDVNDKSYLVRSLQNGSSFFYVYEINDPVGTPSLSRTIVTVDPYGSPSSGNQLGGNIYESGGANLRNEPVLQDGVLHMVHSVRQGSFSAIRYLSIDAETKDKIKDVAMGTGSHYYSYPALAVAANNDVVISFSRSSNSEYIGAYYTVIKADSEEPLGSFELQAGRANYFKTFGGTRNRWGDYNGAWTDPKDPNNVWVYAEFAYANNTWGNWMGGVRTTPFENATVYASEENLLFNDTEIGMSSEVKSFVVKNYGEQQLTVTGITNNNEDLVLQSQINFPVQLNAFDSLVVEYQFIPTVTGAWTDEITVSSTDTETPEEIITASGIGYSIETAVAGKFYGITANGNYLIDINAVDASAEEIGPSLISYQRSISIDPETKVIWSIVADDDDETTDFIRVNSVGGDSYFDFDIPYYVNAVAFDTNGVFWGVTKDNELITIDTESGSTVVENTLSVGVRAITFSPVTNVMYASIHEDSTNVDQIFTVNTDDGSVSVLGSTGAGRATQALAINNDGEIFGAVTKSFANSFLISIDNSNAASVEIGKIGSFKDVSGLVFAGDYINSLATEDEEIPMDYSLSQNYPNPFNPSTTLRFSIPVSGNVKLTIYNALGEEVSVLVNESLKAGVYKYNFNTSGKSLSSGVYVYSLSVTGDDGRNFKESKKMILLK